MEIRDKRINDLELKGRINKKIRLPCAARDKVPHIDRTLECTDCCCAASDNAPPLGFSVIHDFCRSWRDIKTFHMHDMLPNIFGLDRLKGPITDMQGYAIDNNPLIAQFLEQRLIEM